MLFKCLKNYILAYMNLICTKCQQILTKFFKKYFLTWPWGSVFVTHGSFLLPKNESMI